MAARLLGRRPGSEFLEPALQVPAVLDAVLLRRIQPEDQPPAAQNRVANCLRVPDTIFHQARMGGGYPVEFNRVALVSECNMVFP